MAGASSAEDMRERRTRATGSRSCCFAWLPCWRSEQRRPLAASSSSAGAAGYSSNDSVPAPGGSAKSSQPNNRTLGVEVAQQRSSSSAQQQQQQQPRSSSRPLQGDWIAETRALRDQVPGTVLHDSAPGRQLLVRWMVPARQLRGTNKQCVSPRFDFFLSDGIRAASLVMMIHPPAPIGGRRGEGSFKKAGGKGYVSVKCVSLLESFTKFNLSIAIGNQEQRLPYRGPFLHNMEETPVAGLPESVGLWDFMQAVLDGSDSFLIHLKLDAVE
mmetsp:Transcript_59961/g.130064  ORF Transcript_59961/g.130064 Transcript_59961/m.130064 type:complete len:271 (-) Transcript_59961:99-911(-)